MKNFAQTANVKLDKLTKSQMHWLKTVTVMMKPTLQSATLMGGIAVELVSILNTVLTVIVLGKTMVL
jgi:hypothetical protein